MASKKSSSWSRQYRGWNTPLTLSHPLPQVSPLSNAPLAISPPAPFPVQMVDVGVSLAQAFVRWCHQTWRIVVLTASARIKTLLCCEGQLVWHSTRDIPLMVDSYPLRLLVLLHFDLSFPPPSIVSTPLSISPGLNHLLVITSALPLSPPAP